MKSRPKYDPKLQPYLDAYNCLKCHRAKAQYGYNAITFESICAYADRFGYSKLDDFERMCSLVQVCDNAFLEYTDEKIKKLMK